MPDTLKDANVAIAPMQSGSGIQNKILEAMSCGLPVVTTNLGLGNIKAKPRKDILVADSPEDFAQSVIELLQNPLKAREIGYKAREYAVNNQRLLGYPLLGTIPLVDKKVNEDGNFEQPELYVIYKSLFQKLGLYVPKNKTKYLKCFF
jgi:hypothetical protein